PDPSRLGVAREELDDVFSRQERKAGLVLDRALRELTRGVVTQLDVQLVADVLNGDAVVVLHLADEINHRSDRAAPPGERELAAGQLHGYRDEVLRAIELEVVHLHRNRNLRDRVLQHERLLELALLVRRREFAELFVGKVALAVRQVSRQAAGE